MMASDIEPIDKLESALDRAQRAEEYKADIWTGEDANEDEFQKHIQSTAKKILGAIEKTADSPYALEAKDLAQMSKAVCDLQSTFFGKDNSQGTVIMTSQLSMFKGMLK